MHGAAPDDYIGPPLDAVLLEVDWTHFDYLCAMRSIYTALEFAEALYMRADDHAKLLDVVKQGLT